MLAFLDESGDTGRMTDKGSSQFLVVSIALFMDDDEALACDQRIDLLRTELGLSSDYEFHYSRNSKQKRLKFLEAIAPYNFTVLTVAIDKDPRKLWGDGFNDKNTFYKYACHMVLTNAMPYLDNARLIIDKSGGDTFAGELKRYLKNKFNTEDSDKIKKFKTQDSHKNNLLQLVDYCASISNRKLQSKPDANEYYNYLSTKVVSLQRWPQ
ncbi:MAG: DUF3800 domain-containing protein [Candidatus Saccharimonadales bacterium]